MNVTRNIFPKKNNVNQASPEFAIPTIEQTAAEFTNETFTAGTHFTVPAGAAAASVKIKLPVAPILGNFGRTGSFGNSSLVLAGAIATTLAAEVAFVADTNNQGGDVTGLANGEFMVDYEAGIIYGKRADNATTGTAAYDYWASGSANAYTDDTAFSPGITTVTPAGFFADETATDSVTEGDIGAARMTLDRKVITASLFKEDTAHTNEDYLCVVGTKRTDTAASSAGTDGDYATMNTDALGHVWTREGYAPGAEDNVANVIKVEHRYSSSGLMTSDTQVKASAGFVHAITITPTDAAATAGTIDVYDNTSAAGTKIFSTYIPAALIAPVTIIIDVSCANGVYVDFTTTADVNVFVSYR